MKSSNECEIIHFEYKHKYSTDSLLVWLGFNTMFLHGLYAKEFIISEASLLCMECTF